ncbi:MAG TPA: S24/S26 family peptidase [Opitutaceae bacterium]|nr:S24/S26 family peptidase [Opitutaceae bacterium]
MKAGPLLRDLLREGIEVRFEVGGHSMTPLVRPGDIVTVRPRPGDRPPVGAVLLLDAGGRLLLHRHVGWAGGRIVPRGDNTAAADAAVALEHVLGVVTRVERRGRRVRAGLGPEGKLIAWMSRRGLLRSAARLRERLRRRAAPSYIK